MDKKKSRRSRQWFGRPGKDGFLHRSGADLDVLAGGSGADVKRDSH